jgi:4-hydroxy-tetrahydrodipicolinate reductase
MIRVAVCGAAGRMGREVINLLEDHEDIKVIATVDPVGKTSHRGIGDVDPSHCDGVIDFSTPLATMKTARWCARHKKFLVSGTTGLSKAQQGALKRLARRSPMLWAPNWSRGIAVLKSCLKKLATLSDFDFQIEEIHHRQKKDRPSGTAVDCQKTLVQFAGKRIPEPVAIRGGGVRGIHRVWALGEGEMLTLEHVALDRSIFARGAINASTWLAKKKPGLYELEELWAQATPRK